MDYSKMTQEEFDNILGELMEETPACALLTVPGAYEVFSEHFNNTVLERWEERQGQDG